MKLLMYKAVKYIADWFLPNRCPVCNRLIPWNKYVCKNCENKLVNISDDLCHVCAKIHCKNHSDLKFDTAVSLFEYADTAKDAIYALKYHNGTNFGEYAAVQLAEVLKKRGYAKQIDVVTCVPMSRQKLKRRHRNHSAVIAKTLAMYINKPFDDKLLVHLSSDTDHHRLEAKDRFKNAEASFEVYPGHKDIKGKTVLICDDVYTTGSTFNSCCTLLRSIGANKMIAASATTTFLKKESRDQNTDIAKNRIVSQD